MDMTNDDDDDDHVCKDESSSPEQIPQQQQQQQQQQHPEPQRRLPESFLTIFDTFLQTIRMIQQQQQQQQQQRVYDKNGDAVDTTATTTAMKTTPTTSTPATTTTTMTLSDAVNQFEISLRQLWLQQHQQHQQQRLAVVKVSQSSSDQSNNNNNKNHSIHSNQLINTYDFWYQSLYMIHWFIEQMSTGSTTTTVTATPTSLMQQQLRAVVTKAFTISNNGNHNNNNNNYSLYQQFQLIRTNNENGGHRSHLWDTMMIQLRKIPIFLLEDITDSVSIIEAYTFWSQTVLYVQLHHRQQQHEIWNDGRIAHDLFFSDLLWYTNRNANNTKPSSNTGSSNNNNNNNSNNSTNPSWLLFLKITNKFIRRLQHQSSSVAADSTIGNPGGDRNDIVVLPAVTPITSSSSSSSSSNTIIISELLQLLSTIYSMTEKSSTRVWGSYNEYKKVSTPTTSNSTSSSSTTGSKVILPTTSTTGSSSLSSSSSSSTNDDEYDLYTIFWKLQDDFRHPNGIVVSDFIQRLQYMLRVIESYPISSMSSLRSTVKVRTYADTATLKPTPTTMTILPSTQATDMTSKLELLQNDMDRYIVSHPFFLSSDRRVMNIQLQKDKTIRNILIVQMYMILHHLMTQVPLLRTQLQSHVRTLGSIVNCTSGNSNCCRTLIQTTLHILNHSEMDWRRWKQNKCLPDIELPRKQLIPDSKLKASSRKRKRLDDNPNISVTGPNGWNTHNGEKLDLMDVSTNMRTKWVPAIQDHCQEYVEALDPEAGIDDEYHPKNDTMFAWQALRLFAFHDLTSYTKSTRLMQEPLNESEDQDDEDDYLSNFQFILPNGDFENMVRNIYETKYNIPIPGTGPQPYMYVPEEKVNNDDIQNTIDQSMIEMDETARSTVEDKADVDMTDETMVEQQPNRMDNVVQEQVNETISSGAMEVVTTDTVKEVQTDAEDSRSQLRNAEPLLSTRGSTTTTIEPPIEAKSIIVANGQPKEETATVQSGQTLDDNNKTKGKTTDAFTDEKNNSVSVEDTRRHNSTKVQQPPRQMGSGGGGGTERNNTIRSNNHLSGPTQQLHPANPRDGNVDRSHDTHARGGARSGDGYISTSSNRNYHPMDHGGRLNRVDTNTKDNVNAASGGRSRDDIHRGSSRDDHHRHGNSGSSDGPRWDGVEWRNDNRGSSTGAEYHHGRGGSSSSNNNNNSNDSRSRGNVNNAGSGANTSRSRGGGGSSWPRDGDGNQRR